MRWDFLLYLESFYGASIYMKSKCEINLSRHFADRLDLP